MKRKKLLLYIKLLMLILVFAIIIAYLIVSINGQNFNILTNSFIFEQMKDYTQVEDVVKLDTTGINYIELSLISGDVDVRGDEIDYIKINYHNDKGIDCFYSIKNGILEVKSIPKSMIPVENLQDGNIDLIIPNGLLHEMNIKTESGDIEVYSYGNKLSIATSSGDVKIHDGYADTSIKTASGDMTLITKMNFLDNLSVNTVSGSGTIIADRLNYNLEFHTINGELNEELIKNTKAHTINIKFNGATSDLTIKSES